MAGNENTLPPRIRRPWLKIIKPNQLDILKNSGISGLDPDGSLNARLPGLSITLPVYKGDNRGRFQRGDLFLFYVIGSNMIAHKATLSRVDWTPGQSLPGNWSYNLHFTDIEEIKDPIDLSQHHDRIPFIREYIEMNGRCMWGLAMRCSLWKLRQIDYDAVTR